MSTERIFLQLEQPEIHEQIAVQHSSTEDALPNLIQVIYSSPKTPQQTLMFYFNEEKFRYEYKWPGVAKIYEKSAQLNETFCNESPQGPFKHDSKNWILYILMTDYKFYQVDFTSGKEFGQFYRKMTVIPIFEIQLSYKALKSKLDAQENLLSTDKKNTVCPSERDTLQTINTHNIFPVSIDIIYKNNSTNSETHSFKLSVLKQWPQKIKKRNPKSYLPVETICFLHEWRSLIDKYGRIYAFNQLFECESGNKPFKPYIFNGVSYIFLPIHAYTSYKNIFDSPDEIVGAAQSMKIITNFNKELSEQNNLVGTQTSTKRKPEDEPIERQSEKKGKAEIIPNDQNSNSNQTATTISTPYQEIYNELYTTFFEGDYSINNFSPLFFDQSDEQDADNQFLQSWHSNSNSNTNSSI